MAKTYLNTIKYEIKAKYEVEGIVEKPDIIGAIFGQSEGLLGEDMDLKELQQAGKLGRIEISVNKGKGITSGEIIIPSSLDQVKTSILAATVETVEKVGPCNTKVKVLKISDTRKNKREQITGRAKELLQRMQKFEGVESQEIADGIKSDIRTEKIVKLNGLAAGPEVKTSNEILVVEGRADVLKLLSYGIKNAVAMNGSNIEKSLLKLCKEKNVTVLIDGDRGGELNVRKLASLTSIEFVARAPDGKEVEELTQKEILQSIKRKITIEEYESGKVRQPQKSGFDKRPNNRNDRYPSRGSNDRNDRYPSRNPRDQNSNDRRPSRGSNDRNSNDRYPSRNPRDRNDRHDSRGSRDGHFDPFKGNYRKNTESAKPAEKPKVVKRMSTEKPKEVVALAKDFPKIKGSLKARLYDAKGKKIKDVKVKELLDVLDKGRKSVTTIAFDGIVTKRLVEMAETKKVKNIIGVRRGTAKSDKVGIYSM